MARRSTQCTSYIIDTCKLAHTGEYVPGAITFQGRRKMEVVQWKGKTFDSQQQANEFVRSQFSETGLLEAGNEGELRRKE